MSMPEPPPRISEPQPRPVFIYGILRSLPLLTAVLTGGATDISLVSELVRPGRIYGYGQFLLRNNIDIPALVERDWASSVDGYLLEVETASQRKALDDFKGEKYYVIERVVVTTLDGKLPRAFEADVYLWAGNEYEVTSIPWNFEDFETRSLGNWLRLCRGELGDFERVDEKGMSYSDKPLHEMFWQAVDGVTNGCLWSSAKELNYWGFLLTGT
ncbi:hypothetical protein F5B22DRAFT_641143 [Xylaria bambusicola]|uniref:uncharacterized protein n=1 Tax=Xylaria bambusicola TaxID=326684 RepID=UPI002007CB59|nr:uncharacterized protein F5B22DRAFT_641143 [Xylaria bambusicola]KAI0528170.1 hypothetical protein F5B22DRAFT_641143 [Xylaria bambusicola]